ncbi:MAG: hypothetical protein IKJ59_09675 [Clostridia bacterium]|nr:hypothetical protein [Clostridia bacterium]
MNDNSQNNKRIAKNTLMLCIRMFFTLFIGLYTSRIILKTLGIDDYGVYNVVCGFVSMFAFLNVSMSNGIQRFFNFELGKNGIDGARKVYITSLVVQALLLLAIILLVETFGLWYLHNKMVIPAERFEAAQWIFQFAVISFSLIIMQVPYKAAIMAHERMNYYAFITILDSVLRLIIVFLIPYANTDRLILYGFLLMMIELLNFVLVQIYTRKHFVEIRFAPIFDKQLFKSILSFSSWNIFGTFSNMMREQGLNMILNLFFGPVVNAARGIAYQVTGALQGFVVNVSTAVRPQIVQSYAQGNTTRTINLMYSLSKLSILTLYIIAYPILLEIDYVLKIWLGDNVPQYTSSFIIIVILITFINNMNAAVSAVVHATGKMRKYQLVGSCINLSSIPFAYYSLKLGYDPNSVFWISLLFTIVMQTSSLYILRSLIKFSLKEYIKQVLKPFVLVVLVSFIIPVIPYYYMDNGFLRFGIVSLLALSTSSITVYWLGLDQKEKSLINSMIAKILPKRR